MSIRSSIVAVSLALGAGLAALAPCAAQAEYSVYRQSCPGVYGAPELSAGPPVLGVRWTLTVTGLAPNRAGALLFGLRDDLLGSLPLPLDLGFVGAPGCFVNVNADPAAGGTAESSAADGAGLVVRTLVVPNDPGLAGATFYNQYLSLEAPAGRAFAITTTNAGRGVIGQPGVPGMVPIAAGSFPMGSTQGGPEERPVHTVQITRPFWIGRYEVSQVDWQAVMGGNPSWFQGPNLPVETVSWDDAMAFCAALTARERAAGRLPSGYQYRLPTEAEWEYCCRAGTTTEWNVGNSLACADANFLGGVWPASPFCVARTADVGSYAANAWGLHDMHGNVAEWCLDAWDRSANYPSGPLSDPYVSNGPFRVIRGGGWFIMGDYCRSAYRAGAAPTERGALIGFRVVLGPVIVP
jgi:formylglycine-generating enzyme required for sulfatase activity